MSAPQSLPPAPARPTLRRRRRLLGGGLALTTLMTGAGIGLAAPWADAASVVTANVVGSSENTATWNGTLYARSGAALTVQVTGVPAGTQCVAVSGGDFSGFSTSPLKD